MDDTSARLALPLLAAGQAQKEITHNEALALLDLLVQPAVRAIGLEIPPEAPEPGACWVLGAAPIADWAGWPHALAGWTGGGWRFAPAVEGMAVWVTETSETARFTGGTWRLTTPPAAAIADPAGGTIIDLEARAAIAAVLSTLRSHGSIAT